MKSPPPATATPDDPARPDPRGGRTRALSLLAQPQGAFYFLTGAWPVVSPRSFQLVTAPKADFWLAQTVGLLLVVSGAALFFAGRAGRVTREMAFLGAGQAAVLGSVDLWCVFEPRASRAYWLDAPVEFALLIAWCVFAARKARGASRPV